MKLIQSLIIAITILVCGRITPMQSPVTSPRSDIINQKVTLPHAQKLRAYLADVPDLEKEFLKRTKIPEKLGGLRITPLGVVNKVGVALMVYRVSIQEKRAEIIRALLKDWPAAITRLEEERVISGETQR